MVDLDFEIQKAFVIGHPIKHSLSPHIHQYWLKKYNIKGDYQAYNILPDDLTKFMAGFAKGQYIGGNITLPHKESVLHYADFIDDIADKIGAANMMWRESGKIYASNSDAYGFAANLDDFDKNWVQDTALVLGAGGAARAVIYALIQRGFAKIYLVNRTLKRAEDVARHFGKTVEAYDLNKVNQLVDKIDLCVNTTPLGMGSYESEKKIPILWSKAKSNLLVTDIVYTPLNTPFLQEAQENGLKTIDGIGMLLHQAVPGFQRWFGKKPEVDKDLRHHILRIMGEK